MKNSFLMMLLAFVFNALFGQEPVPGQFIIYGSIEGSEGLKMKLSYDDSNNVWKSDSSLVKNGEFMFSGLITQPTFAKLYGNVKTRLIDDPNTLSLFLEPGKIRLELKENEFLKAKVKGSVTQDELHKFYTSIGFPDSLNMINAQINKVTLAGSGNSSSVENNKASGILMEKRRAYYAQLKDGARKFIISHPNSFVSPYLLATLMNLPKDSLSGYYKSFSSQVKVSMWGRAIFKTLSRRYQVEVGASAQNFIAQARSGKSIGLDSFKGRKVVLLDFWGTWCVPCRQSSPQVIKFYKEFKNKDVEIISISGDGDKKLWNQVIEEDGTGLWNHITVKDAGYNSNGDDLLGAYQIDAFPTFLLIDKQGKINWITKGYGNNLYHLLKKQVDELSDQ